MKFGPLFRQWVNMVYNNQEAKVVLEGYESAMIAMGRGVRQECRISLLLFDMTVETLAIAIRESDRIRGVRVMYLEAKLSLYADDVVLLLQNPLVIGACEENFA